MTNQVPVKPPMKLLLWIMISFSNVIFVGLTLFMPPSTAPIESGNLPMNYILMFMGIMSLIMSFLIPKFMKATPEVSTEQFEITKYVLSLALNESTSIFGFIIAYINSDRMLGFALIGISVLGFIIKFPRENPEPTSGKNSLNV